MLGYADVVTSIGAAFGDAVVGVGNLQPLLHLVSPDQALPTTLLSAPTSTMMSTIFKEPSIGCYFARITLNRFTKLRSKSATLAGDF